MGVMEGESAVMALFSSEIEKLGREGREPSEQMQQKMEKVRVKYEHELEATFAAARGFVDAILTPEETRIALAMALRAALNNPGPHLGVPVMPQCSPGD
jgi:acetyl-CoA carboxylase carboxyltransferase component